MMMMISYTPVLTSCPNLIIHSTFIQCYVFIFLFSWLFLCYDCLLVCSWCLHCSQFSNI